MSRRHSFIVSFLALWVTSSCVSSSVLDDPDHCAHQRDDAGRTGTSWCAAHEGPELHYCSQCEPSANGHHGCVSALPPSESHCIIGELEASEGTAGSSSGSSSGLGSTGSGGCGPDALESECALLDPSTPICYGMECVSCTDAICVAIDAVEQSGKTTCAPGGTACVECTPWGTDECEASSQFCDSSYLCGGCTQHDQCDSRACDLASGECIDEQNIWWVDNGVTDGTGAPNDPFPTIADAIDAASAAVSTDGAGAIMLLGGGLSYDRLNLDFNEDPIDFNLAIIGQAARPRLEGAALPGYVITAPPGVELYLDGLEIIGGAMNALSCNGDDGSESGVWLDDVVVTGVAASSSYAAINSDGCALSIRNSSIYGNSNDGVRVVSGAPLTIESSFIANNAGPGVEVDGGLVDIRYSTIVDNGNSWNIHCTDASGSIRNSIVLDPSSGNIDCRGVSAGTPDGSVTNANLGQLVSLSSLDLWLTNIDYGDLHLTDRGQTIFADRATWRLGDGLYDIDHQLRPGVDGGPTYPGADES